MWTRVDHDPLRGCVDYDVDHDLLFGPDHGERTSCLMSLFVVITRTGCLITRSASVVQSHDHDHTDHHGAVLHLFAGHGPV